ncbi:hypothetical protein ABZ490_26030 [Streptomyces sp. NPDC005811]|uniref:hypothetical protein n=1 Tax=Streptomyces sp. NPDC005811 TaxID=3154565 RepID=UPI0033DAF189
MPLFDIAEPETDGWDAWLAHAEALTAAGDPRGEAIRLEHLCETGDGDRARLAAAYAEVERRLGLEGLRGDGSWRFTWTRGFLDEASFRPAEDTRPHRRALVERLLADLPHTTPADPADPEQGEGALIDALLSHPAARRLRTLALHLTDYHRSAEHAAVALGARERPRLERLYFGYDFQYLFEDGASSTGSPINPLDFQGRGLVQTDFWDALPALRTLELEGAFLFHSVRHETLTRLRTRGSVISDGSLFGLGPTPGLESLTIDIGTDVFGCSCSIDQLDELDASQFPHLRELDLTRAEFDTTPHELLSVLADSPILPQLERLSLGALPGDAVTELAPRFAHLHLRVDGADHGAP